LPSSTNIVATGALIYHFDFYRIKKLEEVYDMG
jgi:tRNA A37 threonylcarbamoyladenosine biosynthesis protein TsaE